MATKLDAIDSTAASSFEVGDFDLGNPAAEIDAGEGELPAPPPEPTFSESQDGFFDDEQVNLGEEQGFQSDSDLPAEEPGEVEASEPEGQEEDSSAEISIDVFKKEHKFKLDPTDADLRRTLRRGVKAPKIKAELDKVKSELSEFQKPEVQEKIQVWDELKDFASQGDYDRVFQAILGEQYEQFLDKKISDRLEYEEADPARRAELDADRMKREYEYKDRQREKKLQEMEREAQERRDAATVDKWESYAMPAVEKYGFSEDLVPDADRRYRLNEKLWKLSWDDIEDSVGDVSDITPALVHKVFKKNAQLMKYSSTKAAEAKVEQITEKKQQAAAATAASVATANYPKKQASASDFERRVDAWSKNGGKSAKDLLKFFR